MTWDFQDGNWQIGSWEEEFHRRGWDIQDEEVGHPRWELAGGTGGTGS